MPLDLIAEILDVSKLEAGKLVLQRQPADLAALVADLVERLTPVAGQKGVTLTARAPARRQPIVADPERLDQVLMNLVGNALKFTPAGGIVTLGARAEPSRVRFWVEDTGPGIPEAHRPHIFERFWQGAPEGRGAGLGLTICRGIVEAHGGQMELERPGPRGSRFSFTLPTGA